jgi:aminoglycoside phosphotransferase family enzyme
MAFATAPLVTLQEKIGHLSRSASYPSYTSRVEVVETHVSVVFLTDDYAYKLKKPVQQGCVDFSTLEARRTDCLEELRLNRRLAAPVYLNVVPLAARGAALELEGTGMPVEWLVKMRRLPRAAMLDYAMSAGTVTAEAVDRCMAVLCAFYRSSSPAPLTRDAYRARFARDIAAHGRDLILPAYELPGAAVEATVSRLLGFVTARGDMLNERIAAGRVIEAHGDLRPEHVCLAPEPMFIDCLEFDRGLRLLDTADEAAYLALECVCSGSAAVGGLVLAAYRSHARDDAPDALIAFYQSQRALVRAKLCAWHVNEGLTPPLRTRWLARALRYFEHAEACAAAAQV